jgi:hypothetical protein
LQQYLPIPDLSRCSKLSKLLDHLVGAGEQLRRHVEAKGLGGFEVAAFAKDSYS